ncbi:MAG: DUF5004 domain-containing protein [Bacteroidales bacterium]|nr:DUF5004 domain-containing protein [Bacteroidales bacterium]
MSKNLLIVSLILTLTLIACSTYDEGPFFSFYSPEVRITGTWEIDLVLSDDLESRSLSEEYPYKKITFEENNAFTIELEGSTTNTINGTWDFSEDKYDLFLTPIYEDILIQFEVKRLSNKELWVIPHSEIKSTTEPIIELRYIKL